MNGVMKNKKILVSRFLVQFSKMFFTKKNDLQLSHSNTHIKNILVVNLGLIGDGLLITPFLAKLRRRLPADSKIDMLVTPSSSVAIKNYPRINNIFIYDAFWADPAENHRHVLRWRHMVETFRIVHKLRKIKYNMVVNTWITDQPLTSFVLLFLKAECICGFDFEYSGKMQNINVQFNPDKHIISNVLSLNSAHCFNDCTDDVEDKIEYYFHDGSSSVNNIKKPYILISPFSSEKSKLWKMGNWFIVIKWFNDNYPHCQVVLTGTKESKMESKLYGSNRNIIVLDTVGRLSYDDFAQLVKNACLIVSVESSIMHLASAFHTPVYILFSRIYRYIQFLPRSQKVAYSVIDVDCAECLFGCANPVCMDHKPENIVAKLQQFIDSEHLLQTR
jgi:ADP-heptose:LPS heptosyltransferase